MLYLSKYWGMSLLLLVTLAFVLACTLATSTPAAPQPAFDPTKAALELEATAMSLQLTQAALSLQAQQPTTEPTTHATATANPNPAYCHPKL